MSTSATGRFIDAAKGRTAEGFFCVKAGLEQAIARGLRLCAVRGPACGARPAKPDLEEARHFAEAVHERFPGKLLAYNCSPSFNWKRKLDDDDASRSSSGSSARWATGSSSSPWRASTRSTIRMFELARGYKAQQMTAYVALQQAEFAAEQHGYTATKHQREVGAGYFDEVTQAVSGGTSSLTALQGSTEQQQFERAS